MTNPEPDAGDVPAEHRMPAWPVIGHHRHPHRRRAQVDEVAEIVGAAQREAERVAIEAERARSDT